MLISACVGFALGVSGLNLLKIAVNNATPGGSHDPFEFACFLLLFVVLGICIFDVSLFKETVSITESGGKLSIENVLALTTGYMLGFCINFLIKSDWLNQISWSKIHINLKPSDHSRVNRKAGYFIKLSAFLFGNFVTEQRLLYAIHKFIDDVDIHRVQKLISKVNQHEVSFDALGLNHMKRDLSINQRKILLRQLCSLSQDLGQSHVSVVAFIRLIGTRIGLNRADQLEILRATGIYSSFEYNHTKTQKSQSYSRSDESFEREDSAQAYSKFKDKNSLEILGLDGTATRSDIKSTYRKLVKKWHPDQFASVDLSDRERQEIEIRMREINDAYATLAS